MLNKINTIPQFRIFLRELINVCNHFDITKNELILLIEAYYGRKTNHRILSEEIMVTSSLQYKNYRDSLMRKGYVKFLHEKCRKTRKNPFVVTNILITEEGKALIIKINDFLASRFSAIYSGNQIF